MHVPLVLYYDYITRRKSSDAGAGLPSARAPLRGSDKVSGAKDAIAGISGSEPNAASLWTSREGEEDTGAASRAAAVADSVSVGVSEMAVVALSSRADMVGTA